MHRIENARNGRVLLIASLDACFEYIEQNPRMLLWLRIVRVADGAIIA
jgi:hypothetical protein